MQGAPVMATGTGETRLGALSVDRPHGGQEGAYSPPTMCSLGCVRGMTPALYAMACHAYYYLHLFT